MKTNLYKLGVFLVVFLLFLCSIILFLRFSTGEDTWICTNGAWVKHGNPAKAMPAEKCPGFVDIPAKASVPIVSESTNVKIFSPSMDDEVALPFKVIGEARVFESQLNYRVKDATGKVLKEGQSMTSAKDAGLFGPYEITVDNINPSTEKITVEVFDYSAKDGAEIDKAVVSVKLKNQPSLMVKIFLSNSQKDPEAADCRQVFELDRRISKTLMVGAAAIKELIKGPTPEEKSQGYFSSLNDGVVLQKLVISDGTAYVDFNSTFRNNMGGSCRVSAIRSQIESTLKQFPTVKEVIISVDGEAEGILEP